MWLKSLMMPHLKNDLGRFLCHWWKKSVHTCERCWIQAWFAPAKVCGVMLWYWLEEGWEPTPLYELLLPKHLHEEGLLPIAKDPGGTGKSGQCEPFFMPGPEVWILVEQGGGTFEAVYPCLLWATWASLECDHMPFGLCSAPATFQS